MVRGTRSLLARRAGAATLLALLAACGPASAPPASPPPSSAPPAAGVPTAAPDASATAVPPAVPSAPGAGIAILDTTGHIRLYYGGADPVAKVTAPGDRPQTICNTTYDLAWSPDGRRLATGDGVLTLTDAPPLISATLSPIRGASFRWSPAGDKLAYLTYGGVDSELLMLAGPDGANAQQIVSGYWGTTSYPAWSPTGDRLQSGLGMIYADPAGTSSVAPPAEFGRNASWSPDGARLVWIEPSGDAATLTLTLVQWDGVARATLARLDLPRDPGFDTQGFWWGDAGWTMPRLAWLPDGSAVLMPVPGAGLSAAGGTYQFAVDGATRRVSEFELCDLDSAGEFMVALVPHERNSSIFVVRVADGEITGDLGTGVAASFRPVPSGPVPPAPLAEQSPRLLRASPPMSGPAVEDLQRRLSELGYAPGPVDGVFGEQTETAVRAFQSLNGLDTDGIAGPQTWAALRQPYPCRADSANGPC